MEDTREELAAKLRVAEAEIARLTSLAEVLNQRLHVSDRIDAACRELEEITSRQLETIRVLEDVERRIEALR